MIKAWSGAEVGLGEFLTIMDIAESQTKREWLALWEWAEKEERKEDLHLCSDEHLWCSGHYLNIAFVSLVLSIHAQDTQKSSNPKENPLETSFCMGTGCLVYTMKPYWFR